MSFSRYSGYEHWLLQRISSVVLVAYVGLLLGFWAVHVGRLTFDLWRVFITMPAMRVLGVITAVSVTVHAMIGSWVVMTDYIKLAWLQYALVVLFNAIIVLSSVAMIFVLAR